MLASPSGSTVASVTAPRASDSVKVIKPMGWWGRRPTIPVVVLGALAAACLTVAGIVGVASFQSSAAAPAHTQAEVRSMDNKIVTPDPVITAAPEPIPAPTPTETPAPVTGDRFSVPAVGLDIPLDQMSESDGAITPPGFQSAYWITNMGVPLSEGADGTVFVVMHSIRGGGIGPGNYLTNIQDGTSAVPDGSAITIAGIPYHVTGWSAIPQDELPARPEVWANTPGRMIVITCLEKPDGSPSTENFVITAIRD